MAHITKDEVLKLAKLSQIDITDEEVTGFQKELESILSFVEMLNTVDTDGLEPTYQVNGLVNSSREDLETPMPYAAKELLNCVPETKEDYITVPRMLS